MCNHLNNKKFKEDDIFNTKLYFDLGKYNNQIPETFDNLEPIESQNGKFLQQCLSKDLLDTIDAFIIENSFVNPNTIKELIPLINKKYSFTPKNFVPQKKVVKRNYNGRDGDWICFYCRNLNFSFRKNCNRCGIQKEESVIRSNKYSSNK